MLSSYEMCTAGGTGIGLRRPLFHFEESMVHLPVELNLDQPNVKDVQKGVVGLPPVSTRKILFNTPCYYYFNRKGGCTRSDCHFLHDEYKMPTYTSRPEPGQLVDAKLYVQGIPPMMNKLDLMEIIQPYGYIKQTILLPSKQPSGRMAAIIHMTSDAQADAAVQALNKHIDYTGETLWAKKQSVVPIGPPKPDVNPPEICIPVHKNPWQSLLDHTDVNAVEEKDNNPFSRKHYPRLVLKKIPKFDQGVWKDNVRTRAMAEKLA